MVRHEVAARKIAIATSRLDQVEEILAQPFEVYQADAASRDLAAFYLFLAIQECIDLAAHWVSDSSWPPPETAAGTFDLLADQGVIERQLANAMHGAIGLRNRIAHGYALLDHERIYRESREGLPQLRKFLVHAANVAND